MTVLPDASDLARTWSKWYNFSNALRSLRFVREVIAERREFIEKCKKNVQDHAVNSNEEQSDDVDDSRADTSDRLKDESAEIQNRIIDIFGAEFNDLSDGSIEKEILWKLVHFYGPEQTATYSKEFAHSASMCCPNGCNEDSLLHQSLPDLEERDDELSRDVMESFKELVEAQELHTYHQKKENRPKLTGSKQVKDVEMQSILDSQPPTSFNTLNNTSMVRHFFSLMF